MGFTDKDIMKFIFRNDLNKFNQEEDWTYLWKHTSGNEPEIVYNDVFICVVTGMDAFAFQHVYERKSGKYLGMMEEFTVSYYPDEHHWFELYDDDSLEGKILYYINNGNVKKVMEYNSDDYEISYARNARNNPERVGVVRDYGKLFWVYPNGKMKRRRAKDK